MGPRIQPDPLGSLLFEPTKNQNSLSFQTSLVSTAYMPYLRYYPRQIQAGQRQPTEAVLRNRQ